MGSEIAFFRRFFGETHGIEGMAPGLHRVMENPIRILRESTFADARKTNGRSRRLAVVLFRAIQ